jgi:hypothetical protein
MLFDAPTAKIRLLLHCNSTVWTLYLRELLFLSEDITVTCDISTEDRKVHEDDDCFKISASSMCVILSNISASTYTITYSKFIKTGLRLVLYVFQLSARWRITVTDL